jgi:hypothetical protein
MPALLLLRINTVEENMVGCYQFGADRFSFDQLLPQQSWLHHWINWWLVDYCRTFNLMHVSDVGLNFKLNITM